MPLDRDSPRQRPPRQRLPRQTPLDRDPCRQRLPRQRPPRPRQRPPGQRPPLRQRPPGHVTCGACWDWDPSLWTESQTSVKTLPCHNFVAGSNNEILSSETFTMWLIVGCSYSLNIFTEDIFTQIANYLSDVKKSNSWTMEEVCRKWTWHNIAQT